MRWRDNGQGTYIDVDHVAKIEFTRSGARVFVARGSRLHFITGGSPETARSLRALVEAGGPWVRVRRGRTGGDEGEEGEESPMADGDDASEHYANLAVAAVIEFTEAPDGPVATIATVGGALVGQAHLHDSLQKVRSWVSHDAR